MVTYALKAIDNSNLWDVVNLKVRDDQTEFVASNTKSLLQAAYEWTDADVVGIYADDALVGFLMTYVPPEEPSVKWINRYMIDEAYQGQGHGRGALEHIIAKERASGNHTTLRLSYMPENKHAARLYQKVGFIEKGLSEESGEIKAELML